MATFHLIIKGKVQGVFYRASAKEAAEKFGVTGWVKNTEEGYVEAVASGSREQLHRFVEWCRQGPAQAKVTEVKINEIEEQEYDRFRITRG